MPGKRVLILHGFEHNRAPEHWLWWITQELRDHDVPVQYPQLPSPHKPVVKEWIELAKAELALLGDGERVIITHSLGCVVWSLLVERRAVRGDERVLMVAPPSRDRLDGVLAPFSAGLGPEYLNTAGVVLVGRERDRYRNTKLDWLDAGRAKEVHVLPGEGHLNPDDGHGPFPEALEWVLTGAWPK